MSGYFYRLLIIALVIFAFGAFAGETRASTVTFNDSKITKLLSFLVRDPSTFSEEMIDEKGRVHRKLLELVHSAGEELVQECFSHINDSNPKLRKRAQLILANVKINYLLNQDWSLKPSDSESGKLYKFLMKELLDSKLRHMCESPKSYPDINVRSECQNLQPLSKEEKHAWNDKDSPPGNPIRLFRKELFETKEYQEYLNRERSGEYSEIYIKEADRYGKKAWFSTDSAANGVLIQSYGYCLTPKTIRDNPERKYEAEPELFVFGYSSSKQRWRLLGHIFGEPFYGCEPSIKNVIDLAGTGQTEVILRWDYQGSGSNYRLYRVGFHPIEEIKIGGSYDFGHSTLITLPGENIPYLAVGGAYQSNYSGTASTLVGILANEVRVSRFLPRGTRLLAKIYIPGWY